MNFKAKKSYGNYKMVKCPFCSRNATQKNAQGLEVCHVHYKEVLEEFKCICGSWLEVRSGKFGPYFHCVKCGNINYNKGLAMKEMTTPIKVDEPKKMITEFSEYKKKKEPAELEERKETIISSRDSEYFD